MTSDQRALRFITDYVAKNGYAPSVREVSDSIGIGLSSTHDALRRLQRDGFIRRAPGISRGIILSPTPVAG